MRSPSVSATIRSTSSGPRASDSAMGELHLQSFRRRGLVEFVLGDVEGALAQLPEDRGAQLGPSGITKQDLRGGGVLLGLVDDGTH